MHTPGFKCFIHSFIWCRRWNLSFFLQRKTTDQSISWHFTWQPLCVTVMMMSSRWSLKLHDAHTQSGSAAENCRSGVKQWTEYILCKCVKQVMDQCFLLFKDPVWFLQCCSVSDLQQEGKLSSCSLCGLLLLLYSGCSLLLYKSDFWVRGAQDKSLDKNRSSSELQSCLYRGSKW